GARIAIIASAAVRRRDARCRVAAAGEARLDLAPRIAPVAADHVPVEALAPFAAQHRLREPALAPALAARADEPRIADDESFQPEGTRGGGAGVDREIAGTVDASSQLARSDVEGERRAGLRDVREEPAIEKPLPGHVERRSAAGREQEERAGESQHGAE